MFPLSIAPGSPASQAGIIPQGHQCWHYLKKLIFLPFFPVILMPIYRHENAGVFPGKTDVRTAAKTMVVGQKKKTKKGKKAEGTRSAIFGVGTATKCCELKCCADQVRNRTVNKDEVLERKFVTRTFRLPPKRQLSVPLNFFFPLIKLFLTFVVFAKTKVTMRFRAKNAGNSTGLSQVYATSYWWPCGEAGRTG